MDNSWPDNPVYLREVSAVKEEGVYQGTRVNPGARMDHHAGPFIDDDNPWILVQDIQGDILGNDVQSSGRGDVSSNHVPPLQSCRRF